MLEYVLTHYDCLPDKLEPEIIEIPGDTEDDWQDNGGNNDNPEEEEYDEDQRKPPDSYRDWWYHSDHLGSSTYLTDNFGRPSHYYETLPFGEMIVEHNQSSFYDNKYKFNGKELDDATQMYYYGARYYDPRISIFVSVDPLAEQTMEPYIYCANNPIMFTDPTGMHIEPGNIMSNKEHANAFMQFATTKEGKQFLDKYASKGQEFSYNGNVFYRAESNGEYHDKGINLNYSIGDSKTRSGTSAEPRSGGLDININIARQGFGLEVDNAFGPKTQSNQNKIVFNLLKAIVHESFMHGDSNAADFSDDRLMNKSNLPERYRDRGSHADHYYYSHQTLYNPNDATAKAFDGRGFSVLKQGSDRLKLNLSSIAIKRVMWSFGGSRVRTMSNGSYIHGSYGSEESAYKK